MLRHRLFTSSKRFLSTEPPRPSLSHQQMQGLMRLLKVYGLPQTQDLSELRHLLQPHATPRGAACSSSHDKNELQLAALELGLCTHLNPTFRAYDYELLVPDHPGILSHRIRNSMRVNPLEIVLASPPSKIYYSLDSESEDLAFRTASFGQNVESLNHRLRSRIGFEKAEISIQQIGFTRVRREIEMAKAICIPFVSNQIAVLLNQPRLFWLGETYKKILEKKYPAAKIELISEGMSHFEYLQRILPDIACWLQTTIPAEQPENPLSIRPGLRPGASS